MVERFEFTCPDCDPDIHNVDLGRYVRHSDYATLEAENAEQARLLGMSGYRELDLRTEIERLTKELKAKPKVYCAMLTTGVCDRTEVSAAVKVKPLDLVTEQKLREALRFAASRSVLSSEDEKRILSALSPAPQEAEAVAWMNAEHVRDYQAGATDGIAWANYEKTDFYTVPLYTHTRKAEPVAVVVGHHVTQGPSVEFLTDNVSVGTKLYASPAAPRSAALCEVEREDRMDALPYPDEASAADVLAYVLSCARLWQPEARIIGNARAGDIVRALTHPPASAVTEALKAAREIVDAIVGENQPARSWAAEVRDRIAAALQAAQEVKP